MSTIYTIFTIPVPPTDDDVINYRGLRLLATQTNPEIFDSTYEAELSLTFEQWHGRINCAGKTTIVASARTTSPPDSVEDVIYDWVGMVTLIGPQALNGPGFIPPANTDRPGRAFYLLIGTWIHPDYRRQGIARNLLQAGLDWARADNSAEAIDLYPTEKAVLLEVHTTNGAAVSLYRQLGFCPIPGDNTTLGWMMAII